MTYWLVSSLISAYFTERFFIAEKRQSIIRNFLILGFVLLLIVAFLIFRNLKQKQKSNIYLERDYIQLEEKSNMLEEKNKEITGSI
jgi:hypothetical protein